MKLLRGILFIIGTVVIAFLAKAGGNQNPPPTASPGLLEEVRLLRSAVCPIGGVVPFAASPEVVPPGWLLCDGREVSRTEFKELFTIIKTVHGDGDASNTFNLPDYRGRFLRGGDNGTGRDQGPRSPMADGGSAAGVGTIQGWSTARPRVQFTTNTTGNHHHQHTRQDGLFPLYNGYHRNDAGSHHPIASTNYRNDNTTAAGDHSHVIDGGGDSETRPDNAAVNYIIRAK